jgi:hypothetical protein
MHIPFTHGPGTVGREDRLVRGCIALSLVLLAGFSVALSGRSGVISIAFLLLGMYFALTAALGRDPLYARFGIDTRTDAQLAPEPQGQERWATSDHWLDLRDPEPAPRDDHTGNSLLGS